MNEESRDEEDELKLAPTDPEVDAARQRIMESQLPVGPLLEPPAKPRLQFGLMHLLLGTTLVAVAAAMLQWMDAGLVAIVLGFAALLLLIAMGIVQVTHPTARFAWWCLLGVYFFFVLIAVFAP